LVPRYIIQLTILACAFTAMAAYAQFDPSKVPQVKLIALGVQVKRLSSEQTVAAERYRIVEEKGSQRQDTRGAIASDSAIRQLTLAIEPVRRALPAGSWYLPLDQAYAAIAAAALEPDSQSSSGANHVMGIDERSLLRVVQRLPQ
jgi:hypothetical protein